LAPLRCSDVLNRLDQTGQAPDASPDAPLPPSLKSARALVLVMAVLLAINTLHRLLVVGEFGVTPGLGLPAPIGQAILALVGFGFAAGCVRLFVLLTSPSRGYWWLGLAVVILAAMNFAAAVVVIPDERIDVPLVIDVYLVNGLLPLVLIGMLLRKSARRFFGISRP